MADEKRIEDMLGTIETMSVLELSNLVKAIEEKFGVTAQAPVVAAVAGAVAGGDAAKEEKTTFTVVLTAAGDKKIQVIKEIRTITNLGLKEAKDLVDAVATGPQVIKENIKKEEAEELKKKLEAVGAKVELK